MLKLIISTQDRILVLNEDDIVFCKSENSYTDIILANNEHLLISKCLSKFSHELKSSKFIRVSQSYLININYIRSVDKKNKMVEIGKDLTLPFTCTLKELITLMKNYSS